MRLRHCWFLLASLPSVLNAAPLSKQLDIDFFREAPNRNLKGIAVRSDGRLLDGPVVRDLAGNLPADFYWSMVPAGPAGWLVGTGPEGKVFRVDTSVAGEFTSEMLIDLEATHVFALAALPDGSFLAGTSPQGTLTLVREGRVVASIALPVDSVLDLALLPGPTPVVLVATGNPGRIYRIDVAQFAAAGDVKERIADVGELARRGISVFGEIRDRNVRRLLPLADGRVIAGSAPRGNVYAFPAAGGAPLILLENRDAEVTDLLAGPDGSFYAALTLAAPSGESRVARTTPPAPVAITPAPDGADAPEGERNERFGGRGQLVFFPARGLPEVVVARTGMAFYRTAWHEAAERRWILLSGGEQGELLAYSPIERRSLNLGASNSAQVNLILPTGSPGAFLLLRNNAAGLSSLVFEPAVTRSIETRKLDLGVPSELGRLRFGQVSGVRAEQMQVEVRTSFGSDELEGWSPWVRLSHENGGWFAPDLRGRYVQYRLTLSGTTPTLPLIDRATVHFLPQNRRPLMTDFRLLPPNLGIVPAPEPAPAPATTTLGQLLFPTQRDAKEDPATAKRRSAFMSSQIVPQPGTQVVFWTLTDPDDDTLAATFSISPENSDAWTDIVIDTSDAFVQFEVSHLPEGRYRSRLVVRELAPRPVGQRLSYTFETDSLTVDRTPPQIVRTHIERTNGNWQVLVEGQDELSQLVGAEFVLNNGMRTAVEQPLDGVLDGRGETFVAEFPEARAAGATSVEIIIYDKSGNSSSRRVALK